jgi:hypothetical protein
MPIERSMASQLRLQVLLPVAVLAVLGLGVGAFATTRNAPSGTSNADAIAARIAAKQKEKQGTTTTSPTKPSKPTKPVTTGPKQTPLARALTQHRVVVVLFYAPGADYDAIQTRETRAGALEAHAGFLALNVRQNSQIAALAAEYDIRDAPATVIFKRGPSVVYRVMGYLDHDAIAQAAANAGT